MFTCYSSATAAARLCLAHLCSLNDVLTAEALVIGPISSPEHLQGKKVNKGRADYAQQLQLTVPTALVGLKNTLVIIMAAKHAVLLLTPAWG